MIAGSGRGLFGSLLALLAACGETTRNPEADGAAGNTSAGVAHTGTVAGAGHGGRSNAGEPRGGAAAASSEAGSGQAGEPNAAGNGQAGEHAGGSGGEAPLCTNGYSGPKGGPRPNGPTMPPGGCAFIPTETILARYRDFQTRVPEGLYYEAEPWTASWETAPCSKSPEETKQRASVFLGSATEQFETDWYYETVACLDGQPHAYRNLRCDYFDGAKLAHHDVLNLGFLESLLWWATKSNVEGSALINYSTMLGDSTDQLELCTIRTERGGPGECDEIIVQSKQDSLLQGVVTFGDTTIVTRIPGDCH